MVKEKDDAWKTIVATRTPPTSVQGGGIDLNVNATNSGSPLERSEQHPARDRRADTQGWNQSLKRTVHRFRSIQNGPANAVLPAFYNYPRSASRVVIFDLGSITVQGTYQQIHGPPQAYKSMPHTWRDGWLAIEWDFSVMTGVYNLSIIDSSAVRISIRLCRNKRLRRVVAEAASAASAALAAEVLPSADLVRRTRVWTPWWRWSARIWRRKT